MTGTMFDDANTSGFLVYPSQDADNESIIRSHAIAAIFHKSQCIAVSHLDEDLKRFCNEVGIAHQPVT
ncbi:hypothetical protein TNCV_1918301 [Trichonephila clavipes]|nr:hypothetical protein TNCV_1918301 [Trichonephila clavipes]